MWSRIGPHFSSASKWFSTHFGHASRKFRSVGQILWMDLCLAYMHWDYIIGPFVSKIISSCVYIIIQNEFISDFIYFFYRWQDLLLTQISQSLFPSSRVSFVLINAWGWKISISYVYLFRYIYNFIQCVSELKYYWKIIVCRHWIGHTKVNSPFWQHS